MSKLEKLIQEMCPKGVDSFELGDLAKVSTGQTPDEDWKLGTGKFPFINGGTSPSGSVRTSNTNGDTVVIPSRGSVGRVAYMSQKFWCGPLSYRIQSIDESVVSNKFLFYSLKNSEEEIVALQQSGSIPALNKKEIVKFRISIPDFHVQGEIVSILDKFLELEAGLEAELEVRNSQYSQVSYLQIRQAEERALKSQKLADLAEIFDGTHQTPTYTNTGVRFVSVENIGDIYNSQKCISSDAFQRDFKVVPRPGDVFMTRIGSVGKAAVVQTEEPLAYYVSLALIRPNHERLNPEYLKHWLASPMGSNELRKWTLLSATPVKINLGDIGRLQIKLPPIEIQVQVSEFLDKLEALFTDSSIGLPAEIQARRKQYEYYRNKLLTFKELDAA